MKLVFYVIGFLLGVAPIVGLSWWGFQVIWNAIIPEVFHGPTLTYWQAAGILVLFGFLTSGIRAASK